MMKFLGIWSWSHLCLYTVSVDNLILMTLNPVISFMTVKFFPISSLWYRHICILELNMLKSKLLVFLTSLLIFELLKFKNIQGLPWR